MTVRAILYKRGGLYHGYSETVSEPRCPRHHGLMSQVHALTAWCPHYLCTWCRAVYVMMGGQMAQCETPSFCTVQPWKLFVPRPPIRPPVQAGPMSRGLL
jgi:hypothetical protein